MIGKLLSRRRPFALATRRAVAAWLAAAGLFGGLFIWTPAHAQIDIVEEIDCLALNIYFEARGEPDLGKIAVGHVVLNRVADERFPATVCDVVRQGGEEKLHACQFSWWCDGLSDRPRDMLAWGKVQAVARKVYWGFSADPTAGALWYHAVTVSPDWGKVLVRGAKIGQHIFYGDESYGDRLYRPQTAFIVN